MRFNEQISFIENLTSVQTLLNKKIDGALSPHGISFTEYMILSALNRQHNQTMRRIDLAQNIGLSASGITRLINPMQKIGLVSKESSPKDARVSFVKLTQSGKTIFEESTTSLEMSLKLILVNISAKQISNTQELFRSLGASS
jgi:DNA-binding MarR family transcriptional regulator